MTFEEWLKKEVLNTKYILSRSDSMMAAIIQEERFKAIVKAAWQAGYEQGRTDTAEQESKW